MPPKRKAGPAADQPPKRIAAALPESRYDTSTPNVNLPVQASGFEPSHQLREIFRECELNKSPPEQQLMPNPSLTPHFWDRDYLPSPELAASSLRDWVAVRQTPPGAPDQAVLQIADETGASSTMAESSKPAQIEDRGEVDLRAEVYEMRRLLKQAEAKSEVVEAKLAEMEKAKTAPLVKTERIRKVMQAVEGDVSVKWLFDWGREGAGGLK